MKYIETPKDILDNYRRSNYEKDVTDVVETVMNVYKYMKLIEVESIFDQKSPTPVTFVYKDKFSIPTSSSVGSDNSRSEESIRKYISLNNHDYSIHLRTCYGLFYSEEDFEDKDFQDKFSQYKASIRLIDDNNIKDPESIDDILNEFKNVSATCIDRVGVKYQILLPISKIEEFESFVEKFIENNEQVDLNKIFNQKFISFSLNSKRGFERMDKKKFNCLDPKEFAISVKPF
jgi:hypothetical protein